MEPTACHANGSMYTKVRSWEKNLHAAQKRFNEKYEPAPICRAAAFRLCGL